MQVRDVMTANPAFCTPEASLQQVAQLMVQYDCGAIPIVNNAQDCRTIGMVTDRDIVCRSLAQGRDPMQLRAGDVMSPSAYTLPEDASLDECFDLMEQHRVRRVPIMNAQGRLTGIVATADLARIAPQAQMEGELAQAIEDISEPVGTPRL